MSRAHARFHRFDSADRRDRDERENDRAAHFEEVLQPVRRRDAPVAGEHGIERGQQEADDERGPLRDAEHPSQDLRHPEVHPAHDDDVHQQAQVGRPEASQERRRPTRVAQLRELDVRDDGRPPPELREEKDGQHPGREHRPPEPVPGDAVLRDHLRDGERRVGGERRRDHRGAGDPPRHRVCGEEVVEHRTTSPAREVEADDERHCEVARQDEQVDRTEGHGRALRFWMPLPRSATPGIVTGRRPVISVSPKRARTAATCIIGWSPYAARYVESDGRSAARYGFPNETPTRGLPAEASRSSALRAGSGRTSFPVPVRTRTKSETSTTSAPAALWRRGSTSSAPDLGSRTKVSGSRPSRTPSSRAKSRPGRFEAAMSSTIRWTSRIDEESGSARGASRTRVSARRAISWASARWSGLSTTRKGASGSGRDAGKRRLMSRMRATEMSRRSSEMRRVSTARRTAAIATSV